MKVKSWVRGHLVPSSTEGQSGSYEAIPVVENSYTLSQVYEETCRRAGIEIGYTNFTDHSHLFEKCEDGNELALRVVERADEIRANEYVEVEVEPSDLPDGYIPVKISVWIHRGKSA